MVMENEKAEVIAYFKGFTSKNIRKAHILDNMTIIVRSDYTNSVLAYKFFKSMFEILSTKMYYLQFAKSVPHAINAAAMKLSAKLGMKHVGLHKNAILCDNGEFVDEVTLVWENPNFSLDALKQYHQYLIKRYTFEQEFMPTSTQITNNATSGISTYNRIALNHERLTV